MGLSIKLKLFGIIVFFWWVWMVWPAKPVPENNIFDDFKTNKPCFQQRRKTTTVAVCVLAASSKKWSVIEDSPLKQFLLPSLIDTLTDKELLNFKVLLYVGASKDDKFWKNNFQKITTPSWLGIRFQFYKDLNYNRLMRDAYANGSDYFLRFSEGVEILTSNWLMSGVHALKNMDPANIGVVGPTFRYSDDSQSILPFDMVHRSHFDIFGIHYPPTVSTNSYNKWISKVYGTKRLKKIQLWKIKQHTTLTNLNYNIDMQKYKILKQEIYNGQEKLSRWLWEHEKKIFVVSYSLYGDSDRYNKGIINNAMLMCQHYPNWQMRIYFSKDVPQKTLHKLASFPNVYLKKGNPDLSPMVWRFLVASDPEVARFVVRDADSRLSARETAAVHEWILSGKRFHTIRDHPSHIEHPLNGGLWGGTDKAFPDMALILKPVGKKYFDDMNILKEKVWPVAKKSVLQHDSFGCNKKIFADTLPFPTKRKGVEFVGAVWVNGKLNEKGNMYLKKNLRFECPRKSKSFFLPDEGFVLVAEKADFNMSEIVVKSVVLFSTRPIYFFHINSDPPDWASSYPDRVKTIYLPAFQGSEFFFTKLYAATMSGFERGVLLEPGDIVTPAIDYIWSSLETLSDTPYPILVEHPGMFEQKKNWHGLSTIDMGQRAKPRLF